MNGAPLLELRDIHVPAPPGFWPPAPGWWLLALLILAAVWLLSLWIYRRYRRWRRRRLVLAALERLRNSYALNGSAVWLAAEVSILLRRTALSRFPRNQVAGLSGASWLAFLDSTGGGGRFAKGSGSVLATAPYLPQADLEIDALLRLAREWIIQNT